LPKRVVKTPKLYFYDTGLLCYLLGIKSKDEIATSSYKGAIFENYVLLEIMKVQNAQGNQLNYYYWRDSNQNEIDLLIADGKKLHCFEMKASLTVRSEHIKALHYLDEFITDYQLIHHMVNYFDETQNRTNETIVSWKDLENFPKLNK
jgi:predicted AAA+ superfamily ATPase